MFFYYIKYTLVKDIIVPVSVFCQPEINGLMNNNGNWSNISSSENTKRRLSIREFGCKWCMLYPGCRHRPDLTPFKTAHSSLTVNSTWVLATPNLVGSSNLASVSLYGCLEGTWKVSDKCLKCVWWDLERGSGGCKEGVWMLKNRRVESIKVRSRSELVSNMQVWSQQTKKKGGPSNADILTRLNYFL